jgi:alpha-tubulin suppressor-like RCC1 family protein
VASEGRGFPIQLGDLDEDGQGTILDLVRLLNHINGVAPLNAESLLFADINEDEYINQADVDALADAILGVTLLPTVYAAPVLTGVPTGTNGANILLSGTAWPNRDVILYGPRGTTSTKANHIGAFGIEVALETNQINYLYLRTSSGPLPGVARPLRIVQDSQPPSVFIDFPANGQVLMSSNCVVVGRVGDLLSGALGLSVEIANITTGELRSPAMVSVGTGNNGTYEGVVTFAPGTNVIRVTASDVFGNIATNEITVLAQDIPVNAAILRVVSGDMQKTNVNRRLPQAVVVQALHGNGTAFDGATLTFSIARSDGRLLPLRTDLMIDSTRLTNSPTRTTNGLIEVEMTTDSRGEAAVWWTLGGDAGYGNNCLKVAGEQVVNPLVLFASAQSGPPAQINVGSGNNQRAEVRGPLAEPLRVWVNDSRNGTPGVPVTFHVIQGGGKVNGQDSVVAISSATGHAEAYLELGLKPGDNVVEATYPGNPGLPAIFISGGLQRGLFAETSLTGLALDSTGQPLGGASCKLMVGGLTNSAVTDAQGRFTFSNTAAGQATLLVDGGTATYAGTNPVAPSAFPPVELCVTVVPNTQNALPMPVVLPWISLLHLYDGTRDRVLTCPGIDGLRMRVRAGSMRKPDGSRVTPENTVMMSLTQVRHDELPVELLDGATPHVAWTLQPAGATFDPPVTIEHPNIDGFPAGAIVYTVLFNERLQRFEVVATSQVAADSSRMVSDPDSGLKTGGWGYSIPPHATIGYVEMNNPLLDDSWTVRANGQRAVQTSSGKFRIANLPPSGAASDRFRAIGYSTAGSSNLYAFSEHFKVLGGQVLSISNLSFASEPLRIPETLEIMVSNRTVRTAETLPLTVIGTFADGSTTDLTSSSQHSSYRVSNPNLATVSPEGLVTGHAPGFVNVTAVNEGRTAVCAIQVLPGLTTVIGRVVDSNGVPVPGATVRIYDQNLDVVLTDAQGRFAISNTPAHLGPISVSIRILRDGVTLTAATRVWGEPGGETSTGNILARPFQALPGPRFAAGFNHTLALREDGALSAWGLNDDGQLGDGTFNSTNAPQSIATDATWRTVAANLGRSLALQGDGTLWAWGTNGYGQLGNGTFTSAILPERIGTNIWRAIAAGGRHTAAVREDGTLWGWGANESGQLGDGTFTDTNVPQAVQTNIGWQAVAAGEQHTLAVAADGSLWAWGSNEHGQLGNGGGAGTNMPQLIESNSTWVAVTAGEAHSVALRDDGSILAWGWNAYGQLGDETFSDRYTLQLIASNYAWQAVAAGRDHTVAVRSDGTLWAWGWNGYGQLGDGTMDSENWPQLIDTNVTWRAVSAGWNHTLALREDGTLWSWGWNGFGQLGNATIANANVPMLIGTNDTWELVAAGWNHTLALRDGGQLWGWGWNDFGQLGVSSIRSTDTPIRIGTSSNWIALAPSWDYSMALRVDGTLWSWGWNDYGQLGLGTFTSTNTPRQIGAASDWEGLASGGFHGTGLRRGGAAWAWGFGRYGQLGIGAFTNSSVPRAIETNAVWYAIAAGWDHTVGVRDDGTLWAWGWNGMGQLGDGTFLDTATPVHSHTNAVVQAVAAGHSHTLALGIDGTLWGWGNNDDGQLGNGTNSMRTNLPEPVDPNATWLSVAAGAFHSAAIRSDGTLWTWGWNGYGQLGDGTFQSRNVPQPIATNATWRVVTAGHSHTLALRTDGTVWAWGANDHGQIGQPVPRVPHPVFGGAVWGQPR